MRKVSKLLGAKGDVKENYLESFPGQNLYKNQKENFKLVSLLPCMIKELDKNINLNSSGTKTLIDQIMTLTGLGQM